MNKLKMQTHYERRHIEADQLLCHTMTEAGYQSVFQYISPAIESQTAYTLWISLRDGAEVLTVVDAQGNQGIFRLSEDAELSKKASEDLKKWGSVARQ